MPRSPPGPWQRGHRSPAGGQRHLRDGGLRYRHTAKPVAALPPPRAGPRSPAAAATSRPAGCPSAAGPRSPAGGTSAARSGAQRGDPRGPGGPSSRAQRDPGEPCRQDETPARRHPGPALTLRMLPPDFFTISSSTMDCRQMLSMMACTGQLSVPRPPRAPRHPTPMHTPPSPRPRPGPGTRQPYLRAGDGDPLQPVLAHQILKSQLQLHLRLARAAPRGTVAHWHLRGRALNPGAPAGGKAAGVPADSPAGRWAPCQLTPACTSLRCPRGSEPSAPKHNPDAPQASRAGSRAGAFHRDSWVPTEPPGSPGR